MDSGSTESTESKSSFWKMNWKTFFIIVFVVGSLIGLAKFIFNKIFPDEEVPEVPQEVPQEAPEEVPEEVPQEVPEEVPEEVPLQMVAAIPDRDDPEDVAAIPQTPPEERGRMFECVDSKCVEATLGGGMPKEDCEKQCCKPGLGFNPEKDSCQPVKDCFEIKEVDFNSGFAYGWVAKEGTNSTECRLPDENDKRLQCALPESGLYNWDETLKSCKLILPGIGSVNLVETVADSLQFSVPLTNVSAELINNSQILLRGVDYKVIDADGATVTEGSTGLDGFIEKLEGGGDIDLLFRIPRTNLVNSEIYTIIFAIDLSTKYGNTEKLESTGSFTINETYYNRIYM